MFHDRRYDSGIKITSVLMKYSISRSCSISQSVDQTHTWSPSVYRCADSIASEICTLIGNYVGSTNA